MNRYSYTYETLKGAVEDSTSLRQVMLKIGIVPVGGNYASIRKRIEKENLSIIHFTGQASNKGKTFSSKRDLQVYLSNEFPIKSYNLKRRLISEGLKSSSCEKCGESEWLGSPIPIELHHIDGNSRNNNLSNLEILCCNCHAQTENFRRQKSAITPM